MTKKSIEKPAYGTESIIVGASGQKYYVRWGVPSYINPQTYIALVLLQTERI
jgi:hypothetical protein